MNSGRVAALVLGATNPPAPRPRWLRRGPFDLVELADLVIALTCFGLTVSMLSTENARHHSPHSTGTLLLVAFVTCAPLVLRTRFPLTAWSACAVAILWSARVIPPGSLSSAPYTPASLFVYGLCLYAVAVRCRAWIVVAAVVVTAAGAAVTSEATAAAAILAAIPVLIAVVVRVRRNSTRLLAEQERRHSGERALLEERQRIARELHDVVAHHMSVIAIQAEAAPYKITDPPGELVESFRDIRASALTGLAELRRVLGVLRTGEPDIAPQPGLDDLEDLVESARSGGVTVTVTRSGTPVPLPDSVNLSAYRIVQEALSNAIRHAPGSHVRVQLTYGRDHLALQVRNDPQRRDALAAVAVTGREAGGGGGGHGLIGMRERVAMLGGRLEAGPSGDGGFGVSAVLPVNPGGRDAPR